jgi:hypothetical protein
MSTISAAPVSPTAVLLSHYINRSDKRQSQICSEIGLSVKSNALTVFKRGHSPLPIGRARALAKACDCSEAETALLVSTCLKEHYPDVAGVLDLLVDSNLHPEIMLLAKVAQAELDDAMSAGRAISVKFTNGCAAQVRKCAQESLI